MFCAMSSTSGFALKRAAFSALALLLVTALLGPWAAQAEKKKKRDGIEADTTIFATNSPVLRLRLDFDRQALNSLRNDPRKFVRGRLTEFTDGETNVYPDVAVHLKGAAGSSRGIDDRAALTINFEKFNPEQRFHGLKKIHLNNSVQDPSCCTEFLCGALFEASGVPAPKAGNTRVWINGRDRGLYVLKEGFNRDFIQRTFAGKESKGNFYDGGFLRDIDQDLEKDFGEGPDDHSDLRALVSACQEPDLVKRWERLNQTLDVERFASFLAMNMMIWDWDGYPLNRNNYRIYFIPGNNKAVFVPHGMDQMFWDGNAGLIRDFNGIAARAFMETAQGRRLYRERIVTLFTNAFQLEWMTNTISVLHARNRAALASLGQNEVNELDNGVDVVMNRVIDRWRGVQRQIKPWIIAPPVAVAFSGDVARIESWRVEEERPAEKGHAKLAKAAAPDATPSLAINATTNTTASWRSAVKLEPGRYRFEGRARGDAIESLVRKPAANQPANAKPAEDRKGVGAGLRISTAGERAENQKPRKNSVVGTTEWMPLDFEFEIKPGMEEAELVCELRAVKGTVWFDLASLKLVKLP